jgi:hypothetical protein
VHEWEITGKDKDMRINKTNNDKTYIREKQIRNTIS